MFDKHFSFSEQEELDWRGPSWSIKKMKNSLNAGI